MTNAAPFPAPFRVAIIGPESVPLAERSVSAISGIEATSTSWNAAIGNSSAPVCFDPCPDGYRWTVTYRNGGGFAGRVHVYPDPDASAAERLAAARIIDPAAASPAAVVRRALDAVTPLPPQHPAYGSAYVANDAVAELRVILADLEAVRDAVAGLVRVGEPGPHGFDKPSALGDAAEESRAILRAARILGIS